MGEHLNMRYLRLFSFATVAFLLAGAGAGCLGGDDGDGPAPTGGTPTGPTGGTPPTTPTGPTPPTPSGPTDAYGLTTGSATGVYYAIGNGIAAAVRNATDAGFTLTEVATSQGSVQNAQRLKQDDYQFALMQNDVAYYAATGKGAFNGAPVSELRAVASLYPEMVQIVTLKASNIMTLQDLAGKKVVLGAPGSGAAVNAGQILNASGVQADTQYLDLSTAADRLKDGGVDAVFWTGGVPTGAVVSLGTTHPVRILPIDDTTKTNLRQNYPFYADATLPANSYGGQDAPVNTVAVMAILVGRADVPADDVASLLEILFEGGKVQQAHAQGKNIKLDNAFTGVSGVPWHDGAKYYYATKGKTVPTA